MVWQDGPAGVVEQGTHGEGSPGTWEGGEESERAIVAVKRGNLSERTSWSEGRAGTRNRERERWQGRRAQYPSQHDSNG